MTRGKGSRGGGGLPRKTRYHAPTSDTEMGGVPSELPRRDRYNTKHSKRSARNDQHHGDGRGRVDKTVSFGRLHDTSSTTATITTPQPFRRQSPKFLEPRQQTSRASLAPSHRDHRESTLLHRDALGKWPSSKRDSVLSVMEALTPDGGPWCDKCRRLNRHLGDFLRNLFLHGSRAVDEWVRAACVSPDHMDWQRDRSAVGAGGFPQLLGVAPPVQQEEGWPRCEHGRVAQGHGGALSGPRGGGVVQAAQDGLGGNGSALFDAAKGLAPTGAGDSVWSAPVLAGLLEQAAAMARQAAAASDGQVPQGGGGLNQQQQEERQHRLQQQQVPAPQLFQAQQPQQQQQQQTLPAVRPPSPYLDGDGLPKPTSRNAPFPDQEQARPTLPPLSKDWTSHPQAEAMPSATYSQYEPYLTPPDTVDGSLPEASLGTSSAYRQTPLAPLGTDMGLPYVTM